MAVDLTATDLRSFLGDDVTEDRAGQLLEVARARVEGYAPDAPSEVADEATRRYAGYLLLAEESHGVLRRLRTGDSEAEFVSNHSAAFRNSGAEAILTGSKKRRGGLI